ncbi:Uncharacterised protein [Mycobacteroides abscessus subsp. abscessus]|nr:Uncharacterised protein [Mycobacteroides abscessus subsp. abscessus]
MGQPFGHVPLRFELWAGYGYLHEPRVMPGHQLAYPRPCCGAEHLTVAVDADEAAACQVNSLGAVRYRTLNLTHLLQGRFSDGFQVDLVVDTFDRDPVFEFDGVQPDSDLEVVGIAERTFPHAAAADDGVQFGAGVWVGPQGAFALLLGGCANVVAHFGEVAQKFGAFGVDLFGGHVGLAAPAVAVAADHAGDH